MKKEINKRIQELSQELEDNLETRLELVDVLKKLDSRRYDISILIPELYDLIKEEEEDEQSGKEDK